MLGTIGFAAAGGVAANFLGSLLGANTGWLFTPNVYERRNPIDVVVRIQGVTDVTLVSAVVSDASGVSFHAPPRLSEMSNPSTPIQCHAEVIDPGMGAVLAFRVVDCVSVNRTPLGSTISSFARTEPNARCE